MPKTYEKRIKSTASRGSEGFNPVVKKYYDGSDNLVREEEIFNGIVWGQTISGSHFAQNWPTYTKLVVYSKWGMTTVS